MAKVVDTQVDKTRMGKAITAQTGKAITISYFEKVGTNKQYITFVDRMVSTSIIYFT